MLRMFAALALVAALAGCGMVPKSAPAASAPAKPAAVGSDVRDGGFTFRVKSVNRPGARLGTSKARGEYVVVVMTVSNSGDEPQAFAVNNQKLVDAQGREYEADSAAALSIIANSDTTEQLNPGFTITAQVPFDVPPGTAVSEVELHDVASSAGARVAVG